MFLSNLESAIISISTGTIAYTLLTEYIKNNIYQIQISRHCLIFNGSMMLTCWIYHNIYYKKKSNHFYY